MFCRNQLAGLLLAAFGAGLLLSVLFASTFWTILFGLILLIGGIFLAGRQA